MMDGAFRIFTHVDMFPSFFPWIPHLEWTTAYHSVYQFLQAEVSLETVGLWIDRTGAGRVGRGPMSQAAERTVHLATER